MRCLDSYESIELVIMPLTSFLKQLMQPMVEVFFPGSCLHRGDAVEHSDYQFLCSECSRELFLSKPPSCSTCGYPFLGMLAGPRVCPHCAELDPLFGQEKTLF